MTTDRRSEPYTIYDGKGKRYEMNCANNPAPGKDAAQGVLECNYCGDLQLDAYRDHALNHVHAGTVATTTRYVPEAALLAAEKRAEGFIQAVGLLSTLHPSMLIDVEDPFGMAQKIERHVNAITAERDAAR